MHSSTSPFTSSSSSPFPSSLPSRRPSYLFLPTSPGGRSRGLRSGSPSSIVGAPIFLPSFRRLGSYSDLQLYLLSVGDFAGRSLPSIYTLTSQSVLLICSAARILFVPFFVGCNTAGSYNGRDRDAMFGDISFSLGMLLLGLSGGYVRFVTLSILNLPSFLPFLLRPFPYVQRAASDPFDLVFHSACAMITSSTPSLNPRISMADREQAGTIVSTSPRSEEGEGQLRISPLICLCVGCLLLNLWTRRWVPLFIRRRFVPLRASSIRPHTYSERLSRRSYD
jgi:hypothetical protein